MVQYDSRDTVIKRSHETESTTNYDKHRRPSIKIKQASNCLQELYIIANTILNVFPWVNFENVTQIQRYSLDVHMKIVSKFIN